MAQNDDKPKKPTGWSRKPKAKAAGGNGHPSCSLPEHESGEPKSFIHDSDLNENLKLQVRSVQEGIYRLNEEVREFSLSQIRPDAPEELSPPGSTVHGNFLRSIALQVIGLKSVCQLAISLSFEPKVKCVYNANNELKSKEVTNTCGSIQAIAAWQSCLELEMKLADKLQSKADPKNAIDIPEGGDRKNHRMHAMLREYAEKQKVKKLVEIMGTDILATLS